MFRTVLATALLIATAGCGVAYQHTAKPAARPIAQELPCGKLPPQANCPGPAPARPVPMSPDGPVRSFKSEYLGSEVMVTENGVYGVAATAPGTFAETGTVVDDRPTRPPYDPPVEDATVTFASVSGEDLPAPPGGPVRVTTKTGYDGAYAVIDVPAAPRGTCYRVTVVAPGIGRDESVDLISPGVYDQSVMLSGGLQKEPFPLLPLRTSLERACAKAPPSSD